MTDITHNHKQFKDLQHDDRFLAYASETNYSSARFWATASGKPIKVSPSLWKITITTGRYVYGRPTDFVEFKSYN